MGEEEEEEEEEGENTVASIYVPDREPLSSISGMVAEMVAHNVAGFMDMTMQDTCRRVVWEDHGQTSCAKENVYCETNLEHKTEL